MPKQSMDRQLPKALTNLRLCSALRDCGQCSVEQSFSESASCCLYLYDDGNIGYTVWTDTEPDFASKCFTAKNPNDNPIVLLPLDGRIITGNHITKGGVCDCLVLTESIMCFVEFKTNVFSQNNQTIMQRAEKGKEQLWRTYAEIIRPKCGTLNGQELCLHVYFHVVFDKMMEITGVQSQLMDLQMQFLEDNKHQLFFNNERTFV